MGNDPLLIAAAELDRQAEYLAAEFVVGREFAELAARLRHAARWLARPQSSAKPAETNRQALTLTPAEAAELLGVSSRTIARMEQTGELIPLRPTPRKPMYRREQIDSYLDSTRRKAAPGGE